MIDPEWTSGVKYGVNKPAPTESKSNQTCTISKIIVGVWVVINLYLQHSIIS
jgi:hypothetical protein